METVTLGHADGNVALGGTIDTGEDVEDGGFAGAVGADEADEFAGEELEIEGIDGFKAAELHGDVLGDQERGGEGVVFLFGVSRVGTPGGTGD